MLLAQRPEPEGIPRLEGAGSLDLLAWRRGELSVCSAAAAWAWASRSTTTLRAKIASAGARQSPTNEALPSITFYLDGVRYMFEPSVAPQFTGKPTRGGEQRVCVAGDGCCRRLNRRAAFHHRQRFRRGAADLLQGAVQIQAALRVVARCAVALRLARANTLGNDFIWRWFGLGFAAAAFAASLWRRVGGQRLPRRRGLLPVRLDEEINLPPNICLHKAVAQGRLFRYQVHHRPCHESNKRTRCTPTEFLLRPTNSCDASLLLGVVQQPSDAGVLEAGPQVLEQLVAQEVDG